MRCPALLLCATVAFAESYDWVRSGGRYENPVVLSLLRESDLDTAEAVLRALSGRADLYVEDITAGLLDQHSMRAEHLLGTLLAAVTASGPSVEVWIAANPRATQRLIEALPHLRDGYARAGVLRLLAVARTPTSRSVLAGQLARLAAAMRATGGRAAGGMRHELFAAIAAAESMGGDELAPALIEIARVSRDRETVQAAAGAARRLLQGGLLWDDPPQ